jgi:hypothetical protein
MKRLPVKIEKRALRDGDRNTAIVEAASNARPFASFRYSYVEISALGRTAHVKSRKTRYENGRLTSEAFEGEMDRGLYDRMLSEAQSYFLDQANLFLRALSAFVPSPGRRRSRSD